VTTTTKICPPAGLPLLLNAGTSQLDVAISQALVTSPAVAVAELVREDGKAIGLAAETVSNLAPRLADAVVCEADGSRRRPLKLHGPGEPVIPGASTHVLILAGLDAVGRPASEVIHRFERFSALAGISGTDLITPAHVAQILYSALVYVPAGAVPIFLLNKADVSQRVQSATDIARCLSRLAPGLGVYATAWGEVVSDLTPFHPT
jgi:probable selenium-dependent hydroxylase accessory protein YqeC